MANHQLSGILFAIAAVGCATPSRAVRDDNHRLNDTVTELRGDRRLQDRKIRELEHQVALLRGRPSASASTADGIPNLPVEVVTPPAAPAPGEAASTDGEERVVGVADDGTEIVYAGDAASDHAVEPPAAEVEPTPTPTARPRHGRAAPAPLAEVPTVTDRLDVTHHATSGSTRAARSHPPRGLAGGGDPPGERTASVGDPGGEYRAAVALLKGGDPIGAVTALRAFLARYPRHDYADNAQYWIGEAFYVQQDYGRALIEFRTTIETYPRGNKVPDALLKVGYCYLALGQGDKARAVLEQVVSLYPKTEPATLAARRLETP